MPVVPISSLCPECRGPLPPPARTGRPRKWCSAECRERAKGQRRTARSTGWQAMGDDLATLPTDPLTHRRRTLELVAAEMDGAPAAPPEDQLVHALIEARSVAFHLRRISPDLVPQHRARALGLADAITTGIRRYFRELDL